MACHVNATWQSCTVNNCHVAKSMTLQRFGGPKDLFQTKKFLLGCFSIFFLQGRKSKLTQNPGTKIIFKPKKN